MKNFVKKGESRERPHDGVFLDELQHPDWRRSLKETLRVFAHNVNQAPYSHMSKCLTATRRIITRNLHHSAAFSDKKLQHSPRSVEEGQSKNLRSHCPSPHSAATLANNKHQHGSRAAPPSLLLPLQARLKSLLKRCKGRTCCKRDSQIVVQGP